VIGIAKSHTVPIRGRSPSSGGKAKPAEDDAMAIARAALRESDLPRATLGAGGGTGESARRLIDRLDRA
jgi:hypothetical protein